MDVRGHRWVAHNLGLGGAGHGRHRAIHGPTRARLLTAMGRTHHQARTRAFNCYYLHRASTLPIAQAREHLVAIQKVYAQIGRQAIDRQHAQLARPRRSGCRGCQRGYG